MKKIITSALVGFMGLSFAAQAFAATNFVLPSVKSGLVAGQVFTLPISVNPQGFKDYTVKVELTYPSDLLSVEGFTFANNWMALTQAGYDGISNENGVLIKTAGYAGGFDAQTLFGTVSFLVKKSGSGTIQITNNSFALDSTNKNVLTINQAGVGFSASEAVAPVPTTPSEKAVKTGTVSGAKATPKKVTTSDALSNAKVADTQADQSPYQASASANTSGVVYAFFAGIAITLLGARALRYFKEKSLRNSGFRS